MAHTSASFLHVIGSCGEEPGFLIPLFINFQHDPIADDALEA